MNMRSLSEFLSLFQSEYPVERSVLLSILHLAHRTDPRDIDLCNGLVPRSGDYLHGWKLDAVIQAKASDEKVLAWVDERAVLIERYRDLMPVVIGYLAPPDRWAAYHAIARIDDFCCDIPATMTAGRKDHNRRKLIRKNRVLKEAVIGARSALAESRRDHVAYLYDEVRHGYLATNPENDDVPDFNDLLSYFDLLIGAIGLNEIELQEDNEVFIPANNVKFETVELAYDLHRICGGPPLKTTPGSDFSALASILYEMATGLSDESMAGAVIEYSRSRERLEADQYDIDYGPEGDNRRNKDNFYPIKEQIVRNRKKLRLRQSLFDRYKMDEETRLANLCVAAGALAQLKLLESSHGPFVVWVSQISAADQEREMRELKDRQEARRKKKIELGRLRRAAKRI